MSRHDTSDKNELKPQTEEANFKTYRLINWYTVSLNFGGLLCVCQPWAQQSGSASKSPIHFLRREIDFFCDNVLYLSKTDPPRALRLLNDGSLYASVEATI